MQVKKKIDTKKEKNNFFYTFLSTKRNYLCGEILLLNEYIR